MNGTPYDTLPADATDDDICDAVLTYLVMLEPAPPFKIAVAIRAREVRCPIPVEWTTASYAGITTTTFLSRYIFPETKMPEPAPA